MKLRHIPNIITLTRLILLLPFLYTLLNNHYQIAFYIFFFAGFSDGLDGYLARRYNWQSQLGGFLDPLSDKLFVSCSYITLGYLNQIPWWLVCIVLGRDVIIMIGVKLYEYLCGSFTFHSTMLSKTNTVLQGCVVFAAVFQMGFMPLPQLLYQGLILVTTITTMISGCHYIWLGSNMTYQKFKNK
jgi:cardiolipin synthase